MGFNVFNARYCMGAFAGQFIGANIGTILEAGADSLQAIAPFKR